MTGNNEESRSVLSSKSNLTASPSRGKTNDERSNGPSPSRDDTGRGLTITIEDASGQNKEKEELDISRESTPPPLPPRPAGLQKSSSFIGHHNSTGLQLQSKATTALSLKDVQIQSHGESPSKTYSSSTSRTASGQHSSSNLGRYVSRSGSDVEDNTSVKSYTPTFGANGDLESLLGEVMAEHQSPAWKRTNEACDTINPLEGTLPEDVDFEKSFAQEFEDVAQLDPNGSNEEELMLEWRSRLKHFIILSSAGKPIYSRHGDDQVISHYVGVVQTIISFYQDADDSLRGFSAGDVNFVILSKAPLYLIAISRLEESTAQLRVQLEALYMEILSTLTLPSLERMFVQRPSTDLRRPLEGTETLLSALADGFIRGSPSTLLSALECLRLRKSHRQDINSVLLKTRCASLLYGLIVAGGRLVSVVRPKKHSLHPGDLQLIFNMLFEAGSVKGGGGENWIPLCLPGFNNTGYVYMFVSFLSANQSREDEVTPEGPLKSRDDEIAIIFISANKESFFELKHMRDDLVEQLQHTGNMEIIKSAVRRGRPAVTDIVPGTPLRHFLYKSKGNVQFFMPSLQPGFSKLVPRRRLMSLYHTLHASVHNKNAHLKVHHCISVDSVSLAWVTPVFELYCVASPTTSRTALAQGANKIIQWIRAEEERVFIIGGAVF